MNYYGIIRKSCFFALVIVILSLLTLPIEAQTCARGWVWSIYTDTSTHT